MLIFLGFVWIRRDAEKLLVNRHIREERIALLYISPEKVPPGLCAYNYATEKCVDEESGNMVEEEG